MREYMVKRHFNTERFFHAPDQLALLEDNAGKIAPLCEDMMKRALEMHDAIKPLPHENEDGTTVRHGANMDLIYFRDQLFQAAQAISYLLPYSDLWDYIKWKNRFVGGRFVSQETFDREYSHLYPEMERYREKLKEHGYAEA